ncbi:MAG: hypothetical protein WCG04_02780 [Alphaproteobacteria bacterium]
MEELPLNDCMKFWKSSENMNPAYEKLKVLSVTGGVQKHLELIDRSLSDEENIRRLCFLADGPLANEFDRIFLEVFGVRNEIYKLITKRLSQGSANQEELLLFTGKEKSGDMSGYLSEMLAAGFVSRDYTWHLDPFKVSKLSRYRLKDNYTRFYYKIILPNKSKVQSGFFVDPLAGLPEWDSIMGLQFDNLILNNKEMIFQKLGISLEDIVYANPYFQRETNKQQECQIDLLVHTKDKVLHVCELEYSMSPVGPQIINEVKAKIANIALPKSFSCRPALIHVNGVSDEVIQSGYFSTIIDFNDLC